MISPSMITSVENSARDGPSSGNRAEIWKDGHLGFQSGICDVLIAGSGAGGFAAALTARIQGLDVIIVEKEPLLAGPPPIPRV